MEIDMGKSYKKNPITGFTTAKSEKKDKRILNRKLRHQIKRILDGDLEEIEESILPTQDEIMDVWDMAKDGKQRINKNSEFYKKAIRK
jgi:hypothetical protein